MSTTPTVLETKPAVDEETDRVLLERDATFQQDKKTTEQSLDVKARLLEQLKPR